MPRDDGFAVADTATGKLNDPKFRRLWRIVHDEAAMNAAIVLHDAVQLASWAAGERVSAEDAAPVWITDVEGTAANLQAVGLLDSNQRIPAKAWESWFGVARDRRQKRRDAGQLGGRPPTTTEPLPNQTVSDANHPVIDRMSTDNPVPSVPSVPLRTVPTDPRESRARANGLEKVGTILPDAVPIEGIDPSVVRLQKLAEELTGQAYVMQNVHSGFGYKAVQEQLNRHRFDAVERAWRSIANRAKAEGTSLPTLKQLVLGGDDILNPIPSSKDSENAQRQEEDRQRLAKREQAAQANLAYLRGEGRKPA